MELGAPALAERLAVRCSASPTGFPKPGHPPVRRKILRFCHSSWGSVGFACADRLDGRRDAGSAAPGLTSPLKPREYLRRPVMGALVTAT